ncbi:MAG: aldo/keto reductase [Opitutaceae bacterium]|nr:aldo/keto reductase [Opitutaceae bacterium]
MFQKSPADQPLHFPLSRISLGSATFGREIDSNAAFAMMDHAVARGITLFDTAANYSGGASERIIGQWLAARGAFSARPALATKLFPPYTAATIESGTAASMQRLGVETLDLLYLHKWEVAVGNPAVLSALDKLVRTGRVRSIGVSNFTSRQVRDLILLQKRLGVVPIKALQNNHNLAVRECEGPIREFCSSEGITIISYSPLGAGYLTGKHMGGVQPGSRFDVMPGHQAIYLQPAAEACLRRLADLSARCGRSMSHLALVWALRQPGIGSTLVGGRTPSHIDQAFVALAEDDPSILQSLAQI